MLIPVEKLIPFVAAGFIGVHGKATLMKRLDGILEQPRISVAKYNMLSVLRAVQLQAIDGEVPKFNNTAIFIRSIVKSENGDPSMDPWGSPYRLLIQNGQIEISSAGKDKQFSTADDLRRTLMVSDF